jgi:hypothetical protein
MWISNHCLRSLPECGLSSTFISATLLPLGWNPWFSGWLLNLSLAGNFSGQ